MGNKSIIQIIQDDANNEESGAAQNRKKGDKYSLINREALNDPNLVSTQLLLLLQHLEALFWD